LVASNSKSAHEQCMEIRKCIPKDKNSINSFHESKPWLAYKRQHDWGIKKCQEVNFDLGLGLGLGVRLGLG